MNSNKKLLDILFISPLREEADAFCHWLPNLKENNFKWLTNLDYENYQELSIGVYCLGSAGGINAAVTAMPIIQKTRPRVVILTGIALGIAKGTGERWGKKGKEPRSGKFIEYSQGDVAIVEQIYYHSLSKETENEGRGIMYSVPVQTDRDLLEQVERIACENSWKSEAKRWFDKAHKNWGGRYAEEYPSQLWPDNPLKAKGCHGVSGEQVIKNTAVVDSILETFSQANLGIIEMEMYAIGRVCREIDQNIRFIPIRGISDFGCGNKNDLYRFCATLTPVAICKKLIESKRFKDWYEKLNNTNNVKNKRDCPLPSVPHPCPHDPIKKCVNANLDVEDKRFHNPLAQIYEDITPKQYSTALSKAIGSDWKDCTIAFVFPYSPHEMLDWVCKNNPELSGERRSLYDLSKNLREKKIIDNELLVSFLKSVDSVVEKINQYFPHFKTAEKEMSKLQEERSVKDDDIELALRMSRVVITDKKPDVRDEPLWILFPKLFGWNMPLYYASREEWQREQYNIDDFVMVSNTNSKEGNIIFPVQSNDIWRRSIRYYSRANLLVITGTECGITSSYPKVSTHRQDKLHNYWITKLEERVLPFKLFPKQSIKEFISDNTGT